MSINISKINLNGTEYNLSSESDISNATVSFKEASSRENISSGEALGTSMSKIKKWFIDLPSTFMVGSINTLTDFNQLNYSYRYWRVAAIDSEYATEVGITRNTGDFYILILSYNGDWDNYNFGNFIISSPRLGNNFYLVQMWNGNPNVSYYNQTLLDDLENILYFKPGDKENLVWWGGGTLTTNAHDVYISVPVSKKMSKVSKITAEIKNMDIRQNNVYIARNKSYTCEVAKASDIIARFRIAFEEALSDLNNDAVAVYLQAILTFE